MLAEMFPFRTLLPIRPVSLCVENGPKKHEHSGHAPEAGAAPS